MKLAMTITVEVKLDGVPVLNLDTVQKVVTDWAKGVLTDKQFREWKYEGKSYEIHATKPEVFVKPCVSL